MEHTVSIAVVVISVIAGVVSMIRGIQKNAAKAQRTQGSGRGQDPGVHRGQGLGVGSGKDQGVNREPEWEDTPDWAKKIVEWAEKMDVADGSKSSDWAEDLWTATKNAGKSPAIEDYYSPENEHDINKVFSLEDARAEENYGRREEYNAEERLRVTANKQAADRRNGTAMSSVTSMTKGTGKGSVSVSAPSTTTAQYAVGQNGGMDEVSISDSGVQTESDSVRDGGSSVPEDGSDRLRAILGGEFDLRRAVIEAEILTPKYL
jgi:hypothetical protein